MSRTIFCVKLQREGEGMPFKPFDNELGQRIYDTVSMEAWKMWLEHSKMIVNEYRLDLTSKKAHDLLLDRLPWSWSWVKLPWMPHPLRVEW